MFSHAECGHAELELIRAGWQRGVAPGIGGRTKSAARQFQPVEPDGQKKSGQN